jgi:hypothetical protein
MRIPVYLEIGAGGATRAWALALPGVAVDAAAPEAALAALPAAVAEEVAWLAAAGHPWPHAAEPLEFIETERVDTSVKLEEGAARALFKWDLRPTTPADVAAALARLDLACRAIEAAHAGAPPVATTPVGLRLIETADRLVWLLSRLGTRPVHVLPGGALPRLQAAERIAVERLSNLLPGDLERHAVLAGEPWTTRKVLRRLVHAAREESLLAAAS